MNTHHLIINFGKHKGERWTRVPLGYIKWILNELEPDKEAYKIAKAELERRGDTMPTGIELSNHAIDNASLRVRRLWHEDRGKDEGLYSWLQRILTEVDLTSKPERVKHKGVVFIIVYGNEFPTVKTIMNDKKYKIKKG